MSIDVERLSFSYGAHPVLRDVSFRAEPGQLVAVLGPNGAGKSTLFRCMLGFLPHYQGSISLCGQDVRSLSRRELARLAAYIPQSSQPLFDYTVRDTVLMGAAGGLEPLRQPGRQQLETAQRMMELVGIAPLADRAGQRSGCLPTLSGHPTTSIERPSPCHRHTPRSARPRHAF